MEERGETGRWDSRWRGSKWPWKNISSAGDKSSANEAGDDFDLSAGMLVVLLALEVVLVAADDGWREMVKENS